MIKIVWILATLLLTCSCSTAEPLRSGIYYEDVLICVERATKAVVLCVKGRDGVYRGID